MLVNLMAVLKGAAQLGPLLETLRKNVVPLVREARQAYETFLNRRKGEGSAKSSTADTRGLSQDLTDVRSRLAELEQHGTKQADLVAQMATQLEAVSQGLQLVAGRMTALVVISAVAIVVAVAALAIAVLQ